MTEVGVQFSTFDGPLQVATEATMARRRKSLTVATTTTTIGATSGNLFNHQHQRSHQMQYSAVLPIISFSSISDFKEKLTRMAATTNSKKQTTTTSSTTTTTISSPITTEYRLKLPSPNMSQTRSRPVSSKRSAVSNIPKSSLSYPTTIPRPTTSQRSNQQKLAAQFLYVTNTPIVPRQLSSARVPHNNLYPLPLHQQPHLLTAPLLPRPHPQYGHFLAYLRRQSLARIRRRQQEEVEETGHTSNPMETAGTLNSSRPASQLLQSSSLMNMSVGKLTPDTVTMPTISPQFKRNIRPLSSSRQFQRFSPSPLPVSYRLKLNQSPPLRQPPPPSPSPETPTKQMSDEQVLEVPPTIVSMTPNNSVVDATVVVHTQKSPYELQLSGDMLNYCYVSESGVKYQGQLLSAPV